MQEHFMYIHICLKVAVLKEVRETLLCCDIYIIHMLTGGVITHLRKVHYFKNMEMHL